MKKEENEWLLFFSAIKQLMLRGFKKPAPLFYFVSVIFVAGGVGFWYPFIDTGKADLNSAMTYVFALLAAVVADFFTSSRSDGFLENWDDIEKDFTLLVVSLVVLITSFTVVSVVLKAGCWAWLWMGAAAFLVWFLWWILLEPQKFGIEVSRETIEQSTIGSAKASTDKKVSLGDLKKLKESSGGKGE